MPDDPAAPVVPSPCFLIARGPWVRPSPGIPCALFDLRGTRLMYPSGISCRENADSYHSAVMPRFKRGIQYSRGLSARAQPPLEYWIARSSRAMTDEVLKTEMLKRTPPSSRTSEPERCAASLRASA